jgi:hypothetical protein
MTWLATERKLENCHLLLAVGVTIAPDIGQKPSKKYRNFAGVICAARSSTNVAQ